MCCFFVSLVINHSHVVDFELIFRCVDRSSARWADPIRVANARNGRKITVKKIINSRGLYTVLKIKKKHYSI